MKLFQYKKDWTVLSNVQNTLKTSELGNQSCMLGWTALEKMVLVGKPLKTLVLTIVNMPKVLANGLMAMRWQLTTDMDLIIFARMIGDAVLVPHRYFPRIT